MNYQAGYFFHDPYGISEPGNGPTYQFILNASTSIATKVSLASFRFVTIRAKKFCEAPSLPDLSQFCSILNLNPKQELVYFQLYI